VGRGWQPFPLPADPYLLRRHLYAQGILLHSSGVLAVTNALDVNLKID
jgi:hypothetical protein